MARTNLSLRDLRIPGIVGRVRQALFDKLKDFDSALDDLEAAIGTGTNLTFKAAASVDTDDSWDIGDATHRLKDLFLMRLRSGASTLKLLSAVADGASAVALELDTGVALANAAAKLLSIKTNAVEKAFVLADGTIAMLKAKYLTAESTGTGGNATPTFGNNFAGAGAGNPATAGQRGWLPITLSDGSTGYLPVWK